MPPAMAPPAVLPVSMPVSMSVTSIPFVMLRLKLTLLLVVMLFLVLRHWLRVRIGMLIRNLWRVMSAAPMHLRLAVVPSIHVALCVRPIVIVSAISGVQAEGSHCDARQ
jgi:hypothetical protein